MTCNDRFSNLLTKCHSFRPPTVSLLLRHLQIAGGVFTTPESIRESMELGYRLIVSASDVYFLATGSKEKAQTVHKSITHKNI